MQLFKVIFFTLLFTALASAAAWIGVSTMCDVENYSTAKFRDFGKREDGDILLDLIECYATNRGIVKTHVDVEYPTFADDKDKYKITYIAIDETTGAGRSCSKIVEGGTGASFVKIAHQSVALTGQIYTMNRIYGKPK